MWEKSVSIVFLREIIFFPELGHVSFLGLYTGCAKVFVPDGCDFLLFAQKKAAKEKIAPRERRLAARRLRRCPRRLPAPGGERNSRCALIPFLN